MWILKSELIRREEKGVCFTCDARIWNEELGENDIRGMQAGHFRHNVLDFDRKNIHAQCIKCNHFKSGNLAEYSRRLIKKYGLKEFEALHRRADKALAGELYSYEWYVKEIEKTKRALSEC